MIKKERIKGIIIGIIFTLISVSTCSAFAKPLLKQISVSIGGIKIVVDGETITPKDVNGNVVEPIIYNGTVYLPLRAITQAITKGTKQIEWDGNSWTVYIGERKPSGRKIKINELKPIYGNYDYTPTRFEVRQNEYTPFNDFTGIVSPEYLLKGKYTKLTGYLAIDDGIHDTNMKAVVRVYTNSLIDDKFNLIYESSPITCLKDPIPIEVPLTGADRMVFAVVNANSPKNNESPYNNCYGFTNTHFFNIELIEENK